MTEPSFPRRRESSPRLEIQRASRASHIPSDRTLRRWAAAALGRGTRITVRYVGVAEARRLNREFRGRDYATNVLSFVYATRPPAGDVVICAAVVAREAREQRKSAMAHHAHLLVHGLLHVAGLDHVRADERGRMERRERAILARLGFPDPYRAI